jgi:hypothetical protein
VFEQTGVDQKYLAQNFIQIHHFTRREIVYYRVETQLLSQPQNLVFELLLHAFIDLLVYFDGVVDNFS